MIIGVSPLRQRVAILATAVLVGSGLAFSSPAATAVAVEQVVVPLDEASAFALDPANARPADLGDGATGKITISFPVDPDAQSKPGSVQVFRAGEGTIAERWVGEVSGSLAVTAYDATFTFDVPAGDYELFVEGFAGEEQSEGIWSWVGGGFDAAAARTTTVISGARVPVAMGRYATDTARVQVSDSFGSRDDTVTLYAAIDRNGRRELMPVATATVLAQTGSSPAVPVLQDAHYSVGAAGSDTVTPAWLGGGQSPSTAEVRAGEVLDTARLTRLVRMQLGTPLVAGTAAVGYDLTADHADSPIAPEHVRDIVWWYAFGDFSYQWLADGKPISGEVNQTLRVTKAMAGKRLSYRVTAAEDGFASATATSLATPRVTNPMPAKLSGWQWPGYTVTMSSPGAWPAGTSLSYQWEMNGQAIAGATGTKLAVPFDGGGTSISVRVTAKRTGYEPVAVHTYVDQPGTTATTGLRAISAVASEVPSTSSTGTLRGYLVGVDSPNRPLPGVSVKVYSAGTGLTSATLTLVRTLTTDASGGFAATGLRPGSYCTIVSTAVGGYGPVDNCRNDLSGTGVRVFANAESNADIGMWPAASLRGTVTGSNGAAVAGAVVAVYREYTNGAGSRSLHQVATTRADRYGRYSMSGLEATYVSVRFSGPSDGTHKTVWWDDEPGLLSSLATSRSAGGFLLIQKKTVTANMKLPAYLPIGTPKVDGTLRVGATVTAAHHRTSGATYSYQWYSNGRALSGATKRTLYLSESLRGTAIRVKVTGVRSGYSKTYRTSAISARILYTSAPRISGTGAVGKVLTASPGTWTSGASLSYRWFNNGKAIAGASARTYRLQSSDRGDAISVRVTGRKSGYATVTRGSVHYIRVAR